MLRIQRLSWPVSLIRNLWPACLTQRHHVRLLMQRRPCQSTSTDGVRNARLRCPRYSHVSVIGQQDLDMVYDNYENARSFNGPSHSWVRLGTKRNGCNGFFGRALSGSRSLLSSTLAHSLVASKGGKSGIAPQDPKQRAIVAARPPN